VEGTCLPQDFGIVTELGEAENEAHATHAAWAQHSGGGGDRQISEQAADLQHCGAEEGP
jgi:hypothetical protein